MSRISPLRYPGGKYKMFKYTKKLIQSNNLTGCTYIEPYAGGAGLALGLLFDQEEKPVSRIILNDLDRSIYAFWYSVLYETDNLCRMIEEAEITMETRNEQIKIQKNKQNCDFLSLGFSTFFLNRVNVSGIIKGGVIGGYNQTGNYKMDCRFNKADLVQRIHKIASAQDKIEIHNLDAVIFIHDVINQLSEQSLIFIDPPYYNQGPNLYYNHYSHNDHYALSQEILKINKPWIATYDNTNAIRSMYSNHCYIEDFSLTYSANKKCLGQEIRIFSPLLKAI